MKLCMLGSGVVIVAACMFVGCAPPNGSVAKAPSDVGTTTLTSETLPMPLPESRMSVSGESESSEPPLQTWGVGEQAPASSGEAASGPDPFDRI